MYKKVLVALDGSQASEHILPYARALARMLKVRVELVQVIDPETLVPLVSGKPERYQQILSAQTGGMGEYLKRVASSFPDWSSVECAVEIGKPAEIIVDKAAADAGTLIAMTTHGRSGVQRWLLGSVTEKVLHAARNHLLLVGPAGAPAPQEASLKSVVVPLDGSELAESVIPHVVDLAKKMNLEVTLVRVFHLPIEDPFSGYGYDERILEMIKEDANNYLTEKVKELKGKGLERVSSILLEGFVAPTIIDFAKKTPENLVAMCTHGRSGVGRWVLGSVTDRVVRHSGDPVLVIRAPGAGAVS
jgi:nucleotide-binding universal stress UspA family protein